MKTPSLISQDVNTMVYKCWCWIEANHRGCKVSILSAKSQQYKCVAGLADRTLALVTGVSYSTQIKVNFHFKDTSFWSCQRLVCWNCRPNTSGGFWLPGSPPCHDLASEFPPKSITLCWVEWNTSPLEQLRLMSLVIKICPVLYCSPDCQTYVAVVWLNMSDHSMLCLRCPHRYRSPADS